MSDIVLSKNVAAYLTPITALAPVVNAGSTSSPANSGLSIDRQTMLPKEAMSMLVTIPVTLTFSGTTTNKTTTITPTVQDSADNSTFANYPVAAGSSQPAAVTLGGGTTAAQSGSFNVSFGVDLTNARRYLKISAANTAGSTASADTVAISAVAVFGGTDRN